MLVDTHAHLDQDDFDRDRDEVVARALAAGVELILAVGVTAASSRRVIELAQAYPQVYAAVGIHPNYSGQAAPEDWETIRELARQPKVVALGETGLDRYWKDTPFEIQQDYFSRHIALSRELGLPFIVHMRNCEADVVAQLQREAAGGTLQGVMHAFSADLPTAQACWELGMMISFAGMATYKKSDALRSVVPHIPADRIMVETDCPYLSPEPVRGKRNEPANVVHTARCLASVRGESFESFAAQTTANARRWLKL